MNAASRVLVVIPTYDERENIPVALERLREHVPTADVLVVDDGSPDGTGQLADGLAAADPRIQVRHRPAKQGLGRAYLDGFGVALAGGAERIVQMDADFSHDPAVLPSLLAPLESGAADLVIGSVLIPGARHEIFMERPEVRAQVWRRIDGFLASVPARRGHAAAG